MHSGLALERQFCHTFTPMCTHDHNEKDDRMYILPESISGIKQRRMEKDVRHKNTQGHKTKQRK